MLMETFGALGGTALGWILPLIGFLGLGFVGAGFIFWTAAALAWLWLMGAPVIAFALIGVPMVLMNIVPLRRAILSKGVFNVLRGVMPEISETERTALEAGSTWVDSELFSGSPDFKRIMTEEHYSELTAEEQSFIDGPCREVCEMVDDWQVYNDKDLPDDVWQYLKEKKFFGMIIPKKYGGLGFTARTNSAVVSYLGSYSPPLSVTVMVPNSLGPAELLTHYGTEKQKDYYLPRLANGEEIPCFALTEPTAGSDAGSIRSTAVVFKDSDGQIKLRLNWDKRYITLAAVSTLIGLAVKVSDPDNLLGKGENPGITCILVPANTKGVVLGRRHDPLGVPFYNCPTKGNDVVVGVEQIIGGPEYVGKGWMMLMDCLSAGRAISLPAQSTGGTKMVAKAVSAYSFFRKQFGISISRFEGVGEPLARIYGYAYLLEASRIFTVSSVDRGLKPAVVSAIAKLMSTEIGRKAVIDGMDVIGGAGISRGPRNLMANLYTATPISITVEGANILTRTMIVFGQGAMRCHPFAYKELSAIGDNDLNAFDRAFWGHVGFTTKNACRTIVLSLTRGRLSKSYGDSEMSRYYQKLSWASAAFAFLADIAMGAFGGQLKFKEKITGRFADILSWLYLCTAVLRRYEAEGRKKEHRDFVHWNLQNGLQQIQIGFEGLLANFEIPGTGWLFSIISFFTRFNRLAAAPSDALANRLVIAMARPGEVRDSITSGVHMSENADKALRRYEEAFELCYKAEKIYKKIAEASRAKTISKGRPAKLVEEALAAGIIDAGEKELLARVEDVRFDAISVDSFTLEEYKNPVLQSSQKAS